MIVLGCGDHHHPSLKAGACETAAMLRCEGSVAMVAEAGERAKGEVAGGVAHAKLSGYSELLSASLPITEVANGRKEGVA